LPIYPGLLISTKRNFESAAASEIHYTLIEKLNIENKQFKIKNTGISGLITLKIQNIDLNELVDNLKSLEDNSPYFLHCLKFRPIQKTCTLDLEDNLNPILDFVSDEIISKSDTQSYKIIIEKRHSKIRSVDLIGKIAPSIPNTVNLDNPEMILLIEIISDKAGISWINPATIFSTKIAFDEKNDQSENWFLD
jgi:tRNA(Ser,Leu) C12 N-acetylase TAN1